MRRASPARQQPAAVSLRVARLAAVQPAIPAGDLALASRPKAWPQFAAAKAAHCGKIQALLPRRSGLVLPVVQQPLSSAARPAAPPAMDLRAGHALLAALAWAQRQQAEISASPRSLDLQPVARRVSPERSQLVQGLWADHALPPGSASARQQPVEHSESPRRRWSLPAALQRVSPTESEVVPRVGAAAVDSSLPPEAQPVAWVTACEMP